MRMMKLLDSRLLVIMMWRLQRVDLGEETHGSMVKKAAYNGDAFDEPVVRSQSYVEILIFNRYFHALGEGARRERVTYQTFGNADFVEAAKR